MESDPHTARVVVCGTTSGEEPLRIYADESGTHGGSKWLVIGMLFVPDHSILHPALCAAKENAAYLNTSPKYRCHYKESHFTAIKSPRDTRVAKAWIDRFLVSQSYFRSVVVDWSVYQGRYFGNPFEEDALKKRRAYKKWAELLLQPEVSTLRNASFYLDRLGILYGYDVVTHLRERFMTDEHGAPLRRPRIKDFQAADSWKDANQCLQRCDLLVGCVNQGLAPSTNKAKLDVCSYLYEKLKPYGVGDKAPGYWRGYAQGRLSKHFPRFSEWFWRPTNTKRA